MAKEQKTKKRRYQQYDPPFDKSAPLLRIKPDPDIYENQSFVVEPVMCLSDPFEEPHIKPDFDGESTDGSPFPMTSAIGATAESPEVNDLSPSLVGDGAAGQPADWRLVAAGGRPSEVPCEVCGARLPSEYQLRVHRQTHTRLLSLPCSECGKRLPSMDALEKHRREHADVERRDGTAGHCGGDLSAPPGREGPDRVPEPLLCAICRQPFKSIQRFQQHTRTAHEDVSVTFFCDICPQSFTRKDQFAIHKRMHAGKKSPQCDQCGEQFINKTTLNYHMLQHREQCGVCNTFFASEQELKQHQVIHAESAKCRISCDICSKTFGRKSDFRAHYRIHLGDKRFVCQICGRKFTAKKQLKIHSEFHAGLAEDDLDC